jgi:hypothetical protein
MPDIAPSRADRQHAHFGIYGQVDGTLYRCSSDAGIIGTNGQRKAAFGLARIPLTGAQVHNFPINECWRDENGCFLVLTTNQRTIPRGRLPPGADRTGVHRQVATHT